jgi:hypothetical protein
MKAPYDLHHDAWGRLVLIDADGQRYVGVEPVHAFPVSDPDHWISICDGQGHEVVVIEDLASLPPSVRQVLEDDVSQRELLPVIRRIVDVSADTDPSQWSVETDRGRTRFLVNGEDDVRRMGPHRRLVVDAHGLRYLIPDTRALDAASRRVLDRYV